MSNIRVFLSFEFDKDGPLRNNFYAQSETESENNIENFSLKEAYKPDNQRWLKEAKSLIAQSHVVIVLVGQDTHDAPGVEKEVTIANQHGKPIFQIRPQGKTWGEVKGAGDLIDWKWNEIDAKITDLLT